MFVVQWIRIGGNTSLLASLAIFGWLLYMGVVPQIIEGRLETQVCPCHLCRLSPLWLSAMITQKEKERVCVRVYMCIYVYMYMEMCLHLYLYSCGVCGGDDGDGHWTDVELVKVGNTFAWCDLGEISKGQTWRWHKGKESDFFHMLKRVPFQFKQRRWWFDVVFCKSTCRIVYLRWTLNTLWRLHGPIEHTNDSKMHRMAFPNCTLFGATLTYSLYSVIKWVNQVKDASGSGTLPWALLEPSLSV